MRYYTPKEFVLARLAEYPSLYSSPTYQDVAMKIYEQLFNVIGNGIRDDEELEEELRYNEVPYTDALKFITDESLAYGYTKVRDYGGGVVMGDGDPEVVVKESEKSLYPNIVYWVDFTNRPRESPYPNFSKQYSLVYKTNLVDYGHEWIDAAIEYYTYAKDYFESDKASSYYGAYPNSDEHEHDQTLASYKENIARYSTKEEIEKAYGVKFDGTAEDLATQRWNVEFARIKVFINNTLKMLNEAKNVEKVS